MKNVLNLKFILIIISVFFFINLDVKGAIRDELSKYNEYIEGTIYSSNVINQEPWIFIPVSIKKTLDKIKSKTPLFINRLTASIIAINVGKRFVIIEKLSFTPSMNVS